MSARALLTVGIGDIHGRFHRVQEWLGALESARSRPVDLAFAVGDVEAFARADDHRRKAAKRTMPAEFADYASRARTARPLFFIGGNNEDFEALHPMQDGGELAPGVLYLGRVGTRALEGLELAYLSGIFAPRFFEQPLAEPRTRETVKQAGYFRKAEVDRLSRAQGVDLMLVHEWPRGLFSAGGQREGGATAAPQRPWMGNRITQELVARVQPRWLLCGHSHMPWAATLHHPGGGQTRVACLDQAARPEGAILWLEWEGHEPVRAGWGVTGEIAWERGQPWDARRVPVVEPSGPMAVRAGPDH